MKTCSRCGVEKDESAFYRVGHKVQQPCKACRSRVKMATCRQCGTKLRPEASADLCGFCAPEPPVVPPVEETTPPSAAENRARIAGEQASESVMAGKMRAGRTGPKRP